MAAGTLNSSKKAPIAGGFRIMRLKITAPAAGAGQTSFTIVADVKTDDHFFWNATSATSRAMTAIGLSCATDGTLTITHAAANLLGSETFDVLAVSGH